MQCVENCGQLDDPTTRVYFEQPVWQTLQMFVGELGCTCPPSLSLPLALFLGDRFHPRSVRVLEESQTDRPHARR